MAPVLPAQCQVNEKGQLEIRGIPLADLALRFGTPLYVMDEELIRQHCREYKAGFGDYASARVVYAGKALLNMGLCRIMEQEGCYLDVVSGGELFTALRADFPAEKILFHGNNKSQDELRYALQAGVGRIVIDNAYEVTMLENLAQEMQTKVQVMIRVTPGVEAHTHEYIRTAQTDSKFGIGISDPLLLEVVAQLRNSTVLCLTGFHCHIGSQILEEEPFGLAVERMMGLMSKVGKELGVCVTELNMGGGIGIRYTSADTPLTPQQVVRHITDQVTAVAQREGLPLPALYVEPGRAIVGEAGLTLYRIGSLKEVPGIRHYLSIDGGMSDNPRPALYQAVYEAMLVEKANQEPTIKVHLAGKHCETGDILIKDLLLPPVEPGDILAVFATGAYNYSMASHYNRTPKPAMVLVSRQGVFMLQERETYEDLVRQDRIPMHLRS